MRVGVLSDTHGLLRPEVLEFLQGSDHIVHGGDVCGPGILEVLAAVAPVTAVRGNNDRGAWASSLRVAERIELDGVSVYAIHDLAELDIEPAAAGVGVVISGHSHRPSIRQRGAVLYVNPGSAGPRRFSLPISAAELTIGEGSVSARIDEVGSRAAARARPPSASK
jgi:putative phosphoesterase